MKNPFPNFRIQSLKPYGLSLAVHGIGITCFAMLALVVKQPTNRGSEQIFELQNDEMETTVADGSPQNAIHAEPQNVPAEQPATAPESDQRSANNNLNAAEQPNNDFVAIPLPNAVLLSEMPSYALSSPAQPAATPVKKIQEITTAFFSNTTEAEPEMDAYFAIFTQNLRDAFTVPNEVTAKRPLCVRVQYEITANGTIGAVAIVQSSGSSVFDHSVIAALRNMRSVGPRPDKRSSVKIADFRI